MASHKPNNEGIRRPPPQSLSELRIRAEALTGHSIGRLAKALQMQVPQSNIRSKGFIGQLVERALGADPKAGPRPDFSGLGVELKTIPIDGEGRPTETTFCCSIKMASADQELWENSRLKLRLTRVLWVPVESSKVAELSERRIARPVLWAPTPSQLQLLAADWEHLMGAIGSGRGGTLTAREGEVLHVRPKAANASVRRVAPGSQGLEMTLPLGFYLRIPFTTSILLAGSNMGLSSTNSES